MIKKTTQDRHNLKLIARFKQTLAVTVLINIILIVCAFFFSFATDAILVISFDLFIMCLLYLLTNLGRIDIAKQLFLSVNLIVVSYLFWSNDGLMSSGLVLVFPVLLMVSALISNLKTFISVFLYIVVLISVVGISTLNGWNNNVTPEYSYWHLITTQVMLSAAAYTAWRFNGDMKNALRKLKAEVENVNQSRSEIERLMHYDSLTGLSSRLNCKQKFSTTVERANKINNRLYFIYLDIDNFKSINNYYSHATGDKLLIKVAQQLESLIAINDIACRLSGDEFLLVISRPHNYNPKTLSHKILHHLSQPTEITGNMVDITLSIGATIVENIEDDFESVLKRADLAMNRSKHSGKNQYSFYDDEMLKQSTRELHIINGLKAALKNDDLELYMQPRINFENGKIQSAEALIRWVRNNPDNISPAEFIPMIESSELICSIGEWVISNACRLCKELHDKGFDNLIVAVNISAAQFVRGGLEQIITNELEKSGLPANFLELELTEHILFQDNESVLNELARIQDLGLSISIDDFGTGYSNLGYLTQLKVDYLKIDRSFITDINKQPNNFAIVDAIIKMADTLGIKVVAEGVETQQESSVLKRLKCNYGQGYLWSKPVPISEFLKLASNVN